MKKKRTILIISAIVVMLVAGAGLFFMSINPYNKNGVSKFMNISIDESCGKTYIGSYSGYEVYTYNLKDAYFINLKADTIPLKDGLDSEKVSLEDMLSSGKEKADTGSIKQYTYENYQIILDGKECVIEPKNN